MAAAKSLQAIAAAAATAVSHLRRWTVCRQRECRVDRTRQVQRQRQLRPAKAGRYIIQRRQQRRKSRRDTGATEGKDARLECRRLLHNQVQSVGSADIVASWGGRREKRHSGEWRSQGRRGRLDAAFGVAPTDPLLLEGSAGGEREARPRLGPFPAPKRHCCRLWHLPHCGALLLVFGAC